MEKIKEGEQLYDYLKRVEANPRRTSKGWSIRCLNPDHMDNNNSAIVFDDYWVHCFGGCPRFNLLGANYRGKDIPKERYEPKIVRSQVDYFDYWLSLDILDEGIKGIPARHLNALGWRKLPADNSLGLREGIFIPYFTTGRNQILFFQVRHSSGDRRFSFLSGVTPTCNGYESLPRMGRFLPFTEGSSDRAVLELLGIPTLAFPSASSGALLKGAAKYAKDNNLILVACSDNDTAGDNLLRVLDGVSTYIDLRPPAPYKDYGDMYEQAGSKAVSDYLRMLLPEKKEIKMSKVRMLSPEEVKERMPILWKIMFN